MGAPSSEGERERSGQEKRLKKSKKGIDKSGSECYNRKVAAESGDEETVLEN